MVASRQDPPTIAVRSAGFWGEVSGSAGIADAASQVRIVSDQGGAVETIHWGRNYLYSIELQGVSGPIAAVVKIFRNQGWRRRLERRLKGSKAERSWRMALEMEAAGIRTPQPLMLLESERSDGPSMFVTRQIEGFTEARYLFRALRGGSLAEDFPQVDPAALAAEVGRVGRRVHDAGFWHRDFSIGNLLVTPRADGEFDIDLIDLNRARRKRSVSVSERTRDLCRLGFYDSELDRIFLDAYWDGRQGGLGFKKWLYGCYRGGYLARVEGKKGLRGLSRGIGQKLFLRQPYSHIPLPPDNAGIRDKSVWDELSDQPHQHASRSDRWRARLGDAGSHVKAMAVAAAAAPAGHRRFRELEAARWKEPVAWPGVGVGVGPRSGQPDEVISAIGDLGARQVLLRFHPWEADNSEQVALARRLSESGVDLVFALPQVRDLVRDPARWRSAVHDLGTRLLPFGRRFQLGQAINRSKWGLWNYREYSDLVQAASAELRALGEVEILGPGSIDFEPHAMAAAMNYDAGIDLDITSSLLYVDRRGAPENKQLGFDALAKATLYRAIGETSKAGAGGYWITEVNWPLWEGPHSPAGRSVSVDEELQANYLVRYCLPILASGAAERVYWWQLAARGYGLLDASGETQRRRPAFMAMQTLLAQLEGSLAYGPAQLGGLDESNGRAYRFAHPGRGEVIVAWSLDDSVDVELPGSAHRRFFRDGDEAEVAAGRVELTPSPSYFWLDS